ncbi:MAG: alkaline phosphatase family protein [Gammaproteobacteria bacterium]|nr:alkaline phosphatase family protein [Gammaproteobacteria bacterium]
MSLAMAGQVIPLQALARQAHDDMEDTRTPLQHVIVVVGENHTFDNLFAGYKPTSGQHIDNLLSKGIINQDGSPGPHFAQAAQRLATNVDVYRLNPSITGSYATLPQPNTTRATGLPPNTADTRFPADLPNGPFQLTKYIPYDAYSGDPVHRFFQMWQQVDQGRHDLFPWVATTASIGPSNDGFSPTPTQPNQGGESMGFYNMSSGDAAGFKALADNFAISDNYHQSIMGGTGANFIALVTADAAFYNSNGVAQTPPANQIENPNPQAGLNNWYTEDGYRGGSYVNCADATQPGVAPIKAYLHSLSYKPFHDGNCAADAYYLVNNYNLGYHYDGTVAALGADKFTLPPQTIPTIADALSAKHVSWKYYSGGRVANAPPTGEYCGICDPLTGFSSVMTTALKDNLQGVEQFYADVAQGDLPAVSYVRPFESKAGHPANATVADFERFVTDLIQRVQSNKALWAKTAILITVDEGGGYYDSGYIQPVDFFGDGTRIPLLVVSPFAKQGYVDHTYYDHASILKFIERNWGLEPLSDRSRDNLPNPVTRQDNPYVPVNAPAIGDLMNLFDF